jgi:3-methyl-2-oxobutanoate hydroxymethyltransferase
MGGYRVQGRREEEIEALIEDALALDGAGVFAMVLEGIPREVAKVITETVSAPTIGIGAGPDCDGQVLVLNDLIGLTFTGSPKFVHQYANVSTITSSALQKFKIDVESGTYPGDSEATHLPADLVSELGQIVKRVRESYKENQRS